MDELISEPDINIEYSSDSADNDSTCSSFDVEASSKKRKRDKPRKDFTVDEDYAIIDYILDNKRYQQTGGNNVWKKAEEANICPGRSFWSLKERFRRGIIPNLKKYFLDKEIEKKLKKEYLEDQGDEEEIEDASSRKYTKEEDKALLDYYTSGGKNVHIKGIKFWKEAEAKKICPGRSFWSMRERFNKFIRPNMESCEENGESKFIIKKVENVQNGHAKERINYTTDEDMAIIKYVTKGDRYLQFGGIKIWKEAEEREICPNRSYQSMKERFKKVILPHIDLYLLTGEMEEKMNFIKNASTDDIAELRSSKKNKKNPEKTETVGTRKSGRFQYPSILEQKTDESPMGKVRIHEVDNLTKTPAAKKTKRESSPQPGCSKELSPIRTKNSVKKKKNDKKISPKKSTKVIPGTEALHKKVQQILESSSDSEDPSPVKKKTSKEEKSSTSKYFKADDRTNVESESSPKVISTGLKNRKIIPFFEKMREDIQKNNCVIDTDDGESPNTRSSNKKQRKEREKNLELLKPRIKVKRLKGSKF